MRLILSLSVCVLGLALAEVGMRVWLAARGIPHDRQRFLADIRQAVLGTTERTDQPEDPANYTRILNPFVGVEGGHLGGHGVLEHFESHASFEGIEILLLGGSVCENFIDDVSDRIVSTVSADPRFAERAVTVINGAHHTYKQPQQLNKLTYLLARGYEPEMVIEIDGFNEMGLAFENAVHGTDPLYPHLSMWGVAARGMGALSSEERALMEQAWGLREMARSHLDLAQRFGWSCLMARWIAGRVNALNERAKRVQDRVYQGVELRGTMRAQVKGPRPPEGPQERLDLCIGAWAECSVSMAAVCQARGIAYVHVLQPTLWDQGSKPLAPSEVLLADVDSTWKWPTHRGYVSLRDRGAALAARGVDFVDASLVFSEVTEPLYFDHCHFVKRGNELLWERIAPAVLDALARALESDEQR